MAHEWTVVLGPGVPSLDLSKYEPPADVLGRLTAAEARRLGVLPATAAGRTLVVATAHPHDGERLAEVGHLTGMTVEAVYAPEDAIRAAIDGWYPQSSA